MPRAISPPHFQKHLSLLGTATSYISLPPTTENIRWLRPAHSFIFCLKMRYG